MNFNRVSAIISKDFYWAKSNSKLLGITLMPALMNVFFAKVAGSTIFAVGLSFSIAFIGVFLTSFLLIEEKRKGTLKALLTTPLTNSELLFGKFVFVFGLCLLISLFSLAINKRLDLIYNPITILNISIFSATACFIGFVQGLFFKSEQEMSIAAPIVMLLFTVGSAIDEATESDVAAFFPDYHFTHVLDSGEITKFEALYHTSFSFLIALAAFIFATSFAKFYFSSNEEKRFSSKLAVIFSTFLTLFVLSGFISPKLINEGKKQKKANLELFKIDSTHWKGSFSYNPSTTLIKKVINNKSLKRLKLESGDAEIGIQIRDVKTNEETEEKRIKKIRSKKTNTILATESIIHKSLKFNRWVYWQKDEKLSILIESFCNKQLLQIFTDVKKNDLQKIQSTSKFLNSTFSSLNVKCL